MSGKLRRSNIKWESSTEEDDTCESKYKMRLRESLRSTQQPAVVDNEIVMEPRRRGRGPSKRPCLNRNALMARENRLRKKAYLEKIENKLSFYEQENKNLVSVIRKQGMDIKRLSGEVSYLKSVLNNNNTITALLRTINDGLRKISAQTKNAFHPNHVTEYPSELHMQQKSMCYTNLRENEINTQNTDVFIANVNGDISTGHSTTENQGSESYVNQKRSFACKNLNIDKTSLSLSDSDRTYTTSQISAVNMKNNHRNKEASNTITSTTSSISEDSYMDSAKELDNLLPITQTDLHSVIEKKDTETSGIDFDQLPSFNMDIFEDLPKCDEMIDTVDSLNETSNLFTEEEISQTLDNTGICLHVNSDKVSLEFCSICHLNSKESRLN